MNFNPIGYSVAVTCPVCGDQYSKVTDSRGRTDGSQRRRRKCRNGHTFTTRELTMQALAYGMTMDSFDPGL